MKVFKKSLLFASMLTFLLCALNVFAVPSTSQKASSVFLRTLGGSDEEMAYAVVQTSDGGYIVAGWTSSNDDDVSGNHGEKDAWVVKLNEEGNVQWQKCLGGSGHDAANDVEQTKDGGYIVVGWTSSNDGDVTENRGEVDAWVVKLDREGNIQWQRCLGGSWYDRANDVEQTSDGGYIVVGSTRSTDGDVTGNHGKEDAWVVKLDASGNIQWQKCLGGSDREEAHAVEQTSDGGYILAGWTWSEDGDVSGNHGNGDAWVVKLDREGNIQWQKCLGGSDADGVYDVEQSSDGGYIVVGSTGSNDGDVEGYHPGRFGIHSEGDAWVVKLDREGNIQWQRCLGGSDQDEAYDVEQTLDGGYILAGSTRSNDGDVSERRAGMGTDFWVVKLDEEGKIQWQRRLGGFFYDGARAVEQTSDGGYIVAGWTDSNDGDVSGSHGKRDVWVVKLACQE